MEFPNMLVLAMGPMIFGAAFLPRLKWPVVGAILFTAAALPSVLFAYFCAYLLAHPQGDMVTLPVIILAVAGLLLLAVAVHFGDRLSRGVGLLALAAMSGVPMAVMVAFYPHVQQTFHEAANIPSQEDLERFARERRVAERAGRERRRQDLALLKRELPQCSATLSDRSGRATAAADYRQGKRQLQVLNVFGQESMSSLVPLPGRDETYHGGPGHGLRHVDVVVRTGQPTVRFPTIEPPFRLWSDPWGNRMFPELHPIINTCNIAVMTYAKAYNSRMLALVRMRPSR